jgi:hypothetical protein
MCLLAWTWEDGARKRLLPVASCQCNNVPCCRCYTTAGSLADAQISCAVWASAARSAQCQQHLVSKHLPNSLRPCRPPITCMGDPRIIIFSGACACCPMLARYLLSANH